MAILVWLVVILILCWVAATYTTHLERKHSAKLVELESLRVESRELKNTLNRIEITAREHYDLAPVFANVILDDINGYRRKELGQ